MISPTYTKSWGIWCLALAMFRWTRAEQDEVFLKRPTEAAEIRRRMQVIRETRAIPLDEFLPPRSSKEMT